MPATACRICRSWHRYSPPSEICAPRHRRPLHARRLSRTRATGVRRGANQRRRHAARRPDPSSSIATSVPADRARRAWSATSIARSRSTPDTVRGGALLIHGLTDGPYSMRAIAEQLRAEGFYSLALRMPGHGTVPAGLVTSTADDWNAAVRLGVRHVRERIGAAAPAGPRRLLERRRARHALRARRDRGPGAAEAESPDPRLADDWRQPAGAAGERDQRARCDPLLREGTLARRRPRVQPVQVQLVSRERRAVRPISSPTSCRSGWRAPRATGSWRSFRRCCPSSRSSTRP